MASQPASSKGAATRELIIDRAYAIASRQGLEGLSIGDLAQAVGMSKSGVFAHFGSREDLQLAVLDEGGRRFGEFVLVPALRKPRGLVRLRAIIDGWFDWVRENQHGCLVMSAISEYDSRPGPLHDAVVARVQRWPQAIPQYAVGFQRYKDACLQAELSAPGLFIAGTCRDGVSLSNCIAAGNRIADVASRYLWPA